MNGTAEGTALEGTAEEGTALRARARARAVMIIRWEGRAAGAAFSASNPLCYQTAPLMNRDGCCCRYLHSPTRSLPARSCPLRLASTAYGTISPLTGLVRARSACNSLSVGAICVKGAHQLIFVCLLFQVEAQAVNSGRFVKHWGADAAQALAALAPA